MSKVKLNFGQRMAALKWAKKQLAKEKAEIESKYMPQPPLDQANQYSITKHTESPTSITEMPKPVIHIIAKPINTLEAALNKLREQINQK